MKLLITLIYVTIIGQACFFIGVSLPRNLFNEKLFPFKSFSFEKSGKLYRFFRVKKWKTRVPDMSRYTNVIYPKKVYAKITSKEANRLVKESCVAEMTHYALSILGIGIYYIWKKSSTGIILTILYILMNLPFIIIQRYLRPKYIDIRDKLIIREEQREYAKI